MTLLACGLEYAQHKGWIGKQRAGGWDSFFDAYQYQAGWIFLVNVYLGAAMAILFIWGYMRLLVKLVDENGNTTGRLW